LKDQNHHFQGMKSFSKLFLTAFIVSVLSIGLIITQANSQRDIQARAHSLVTKNVALLADVNHLLVLINREIMAGSDYLQGGDETHFNEKHQQFHDELTATLNSLTNAASSNKHLANISANVLAYHRVLSGINPAEAPPQQISQAIIVLQQQSTELTVLIDELHQQLAQDIGEAQTAISRAGNNAMVQTTLMALALLTAMMVAFYLMRARLRAQRRERELSYFPERAPEAMLTIDDNGDVIYANPKAEQVLYDNGFERKDVKQLLPAPIKATITDIKASAINTASWSHRLGSTTFKTTLQWLRDLNQGHVYFHDVSHTEDLQKRLNYLAYFDPLTSLPNRRRFEEEIENILSLNNFGKARHWAIGLIRLDRFAHMTSGHGYSVGDSLLAACAKRLSDAIQDYHDASLFRFDGARFGILVLESQGAEIADALNKSMENPVVVEDISFYLTLSIGYTITPSDEQEVSKLIINAGAALESASERGGNRVCEFTHEMRARELQSLNMEIALRQALFAGELDVYYQPQVSSIDGRLTGMEALIRWQTREGEFISPSEFIPLAERIGLIVVLGEWVLHRAFKQAVEWQKTFGEYLIMSVNISFKQFSHVHFLDMLRSAIETSGVDPRLIDIEITESVMQENIERTMNILQEMKRMGFSISIDDFGTGYSSMSYLKYLPVDKIKIDRAFVTGISLESGEDQTSNKAIVASIVELGHNLKLEVVAEGVDNSAQVAYLSSIGCDYFQGFLFSQALPSDSMETFIRDHFSQRLHPTDLGA
jgi:diguanylate cyclase (GGDEF)-like protein